MQPTKLVPFGSVAAKIGLRLLRPCPFDASKAIPVPLEDRITLFGRIQQQSDQSRTRAILFQTEIGPGALLIAINQIGFRKQLQMTRDSWLRLAENFGKIGDREIARGQKRQKTQAGWFTRRLQ